MAEKIHPNSYKIHQNHFVKEWEHTAITTNRKMRQRKKELTKLNKFSDEEKNGKMRLISN